MNQTRLALTLAAAGLAVGSLVAVSPAATAAPADNATPAARATVASGSIVFVKGHNLWLVRGDGTGLYQVTTDGTRGTPYDAPTMSDNGIIAAMRGDRIVRLRQNGAVLNTLKPIDLFVEGAGDTINLTPVTDPVISPDGSKIAYSQFRLASYGGTMKAESLTSFTRADRYTGPSSFGLVEASSPSWVTNDRLVMRKYGDVHLYQLGSATTQRWFTTSDTHPDGGWFGMNHPEISPDGQHFVASAEDQSVLWGNVTGSPATSIPPPPTATCNLTTDQPHSEGAAIFATPSWGPDSDSIAYEELGDLWVASKINACGPTTVTRQIVSGGTSPDWSSAALSPAARSFALVAKPKIKGTLKVGRTVKATAGNWSPTPSSIRYAWLRNGRPIKKATGKSYRLKSADRGKRISVKVTVTRSAHKSRSATSASHRVK